MNEKRFVILFLSIILSIPLLFASTFIGTTHVKGGDWVIVEVTLYDFLIPLFAAIFITVYAVFFLHVIEDNKEVKKFRKKSQ